jgi:type VI secretion system protein ImpE
MSHTKALFDAGELGAAIAEVTQGVKAHPTDASLRTFLFELLCFAGEWDRAEKQLDALGHQDVKAEIGVQVYRNNIKAERDRSRLFSDGLQPHFLMEPPAYVDLHLAAINRLREGNTAEARETLDRAEDERPALAGTFNGRRFEDFRDWDDLVGPVLESIINGQYTWLPFEQVGRIEVNPPKQARDLVWASARIEATDGTIGEVYIPALYAGSSQHPDDQVRLGRMTDWKRLSDDLSVAVGLRLFLVDGEDRPLFEARSVEFERVKP